MTHSDGKTAVQTAPEVFAGREFAYTQRDFQQIAAMLHRSAGIALNETKAPLVYSRLAKRLRKVGVDSFKRYCELLESEDGADERYNMIAVLTTNVTKFFREPHHFEHLKTRVLPDLLEKVRHGGPLRIWSAGCSSGEESYSIALTILSLMPDAPRHDIKVLAIDINKYVLEQGQRGVYGESALGPVAPQQRADWFNTANREDGEQCWRVGDELRGLVVFRPLNLMEDWPMKRAYDAIFCRNVAIYFEPQDQTQLWNRMAALLAPRGCLYVGHSERVSDADARFDLEGLTTYRLKNGAKTMETR